MLTDQAEIEEFMPDGGHQIGNPQRDDVWFWYNPAVEMIIQEEVEPSEVIGLFKTKDDADRFIQQYATKYEIEDVSHLERYSADLTYEEQGPVLEDSDFDRLDPAATEQINFSGFGSENCEKINRWLTSDSPTAPTRG